MGFAAEVSELPPAWCIECRRPRADECNYPTLRLPTRISPRDQEGRFTCARVSAWALLFLVVCIGVAMAFTRVSSDENRYYYATGAGVGAGAVTTGLFLRTVPAEPGMGAVLPGPR